MFLLPHGHLTEGVFVMDIREALDYLDSRFYDHDIASNDDSKVYALGYDINYTPSMWDHGDAVPGVTFCRFNKYVILISDLVHEYEYLLRQDEDEDGHSKYILQGIDFDISYTQNPAWDKEVEAIACVAEYAC